MNKILSYLEICGLLFTMSACNDFLTEEPTNSISSENAFDSESDVENNLVGAYSTLGETGLLGRDLLCLGDACADACYHTSASYNFLQLAAWNVSETDDDLNYIWQYGYEVIDRTARIIEAGSNFSGATIDGYLAQAHALRAWTTFYLTNIFGLPYTENPSASGIVNVETPIATGTKVSRNTVAENYEFILADIKDAESYYNESDVSDPGVYYFNKAAVEALKSRVYLFMGNYKEAREAALAAIAAFGNDKLVDTEAAYSAMWNTSSMSSEDIMRFQRSATQTHDYYFMWGPSGGIAFVPEILTEFSSDDIRRSIYTSTMYGKFVGTELGNATLSIPMFRLAELYLTIAETYAVGDDIDYTKAAEYLAIVSDARHSAISGHIETNSNILQQIQQERKWETLQEGFRWFDVRRWGLKISVYNGKYTNFDIAKFCYPIPSAEINSGFGVTQTTDWSSALPK